jgi:uncharacterized membrane protein YhfC
LIAPDYPAEAILIPVLAAGANLLMSSGLVHARHRRPHNLAARNAYGCGHSGLKTVWIFYLVSVAEDARFELARACTQHAFQACALGH